MVKHHQTITLYGKLLFERIEITQPHSKPNLIPKEGCLLFLMEGAHNVYSETSHIHLKAREAVLMRCGNYIMKMRPNPDSGNFHAVAIHFHRDIIEKVYENDLPAFLLNGTSQTRMANLGTDILLKKYFEGLLYYFEEPTLMNDEFLKLKLKEIIFLLMQTEHSDYLKELLDNLFNKHVYHFKEVVESHIFSPITIPELAMLTNHSPSTFNRKFKAYYKVSPNRYIRDKRLDRAADLLSVSDMNVSSVAFECGFNDIPHFSKTFKQRFKIPPSLYQKQKKAQENKEYDKQIIV